MTHSEDLTRLFADRITKEPRFMRLRRNWLLFLRWWYQWRITRHQAVEGRCWRKRREVLERLTEVDEAGRGLW